MLFFNRIITTPSNQKVFFNLIHKMAAPNKKSQKKTKPSLNNNKVIVNSNKVSEERSKSPESEVSKASTDLEVNEFEEFYNKALKEYINFKENGEVAAKEAKQSFVVKFSKVSLRWIYNVSITIFLIYLLKLYIVYQMRTHLSVLSMAPKAVTHTIDNVRFFILSTFQFFLSFLQNTFGIFNNLKLKNEKNILVDHLIMGLKNENPHRSNVNSVLLYISLIKAIISDNIKLILPYSARKYICLVNKSIKEHLSIFHQRVFVEIANLWKTHHATSYDIVVEFIELIIKKLQFFLNLILEKVKQIVF